MQIDVLDNAESLIQARESWEAVYASDPEAQFFLSWTWIRNSIIGPKGSQGCSVLAWRMPVRAERVLAEREAA